MVFHLSFTLRNVQRGLPPDEVSREIPYRDTISQSATFTQCNVSYRGYFIDRSTQARNSCTRVLIVRTNCNEFTRKMNTSAWTPTFLAIGRSFNRFLPSYDTRFSSIATVNNRRNDISSLQSRWSRLGDTIPNSASARLYLERCLEATFIAQGLIFVILEIIRRRRSEVKPDNATIRISSSSASLRRTRRGGTKEERQDRLSSRCGPRTFDLDALRCQLELDSCACVSRRRSWTRGNAV